jgi:nanoRNase/pAp phosphatase (c-di-AMP/oligoRNAs hydrolase)
MDHHPAVRRKPREERRSKAEAVARQTFSDPTVLIVTDDPAFLEPLMADETDVWRWRVKGKARRADEVRREFAGDPCDPATFEWIGMLHDVTVIIALGDAYDNAAAAAAVQAMNADAAVVVVGDHDLPGRAGPLARLVDWRRALCTRLEEELRRVETMKRVHALRTFIEDAEIVPILLHNDPDPDALASALALRALLRRQPQVMPVLTLDVMTRPENRRMADLLDLQVTQVTLEELCVFDRIICTDMQPRVFKDKPMPRLAVVDHHPPEKGYEAEYLDIRPKYGATATIVTEYLRADDERRIGERLAAGMVYGIKTDTDALTRGVSSADVAAYSFLLDRADNELLRLMERPSYAEDIARAYGDALAGLLIKDDLAVAYLGEISVEEAHILADVADFCLGIKEPVWAAAAAIVEGRLVITLRHLGGEPGAGHLARLLAENGRGAGGGHVTMARAVLHLDDEWGALKDAPIDAAREIFLNQISAYLDRIR